MTKKKKKDDIKEIELTPNSSEGETEDQLQTFDRDVVLRKSLDEQAQKSKGPESDVLSGDVTLELDEEAPIENVTPTENEVAGFVSQKSFKGKSDSDDVADEQDSVVSFKSSASTKDQHAEVIDDLPYDSKIPTLNIVESVEDMGKENEDILGEQSDVTKVFVSSEKPIVNDVASSDKAAQPEVEQTEEPITEEHLNGGSPESELRSDEKKTGEEINLEIKAEGEEYRKDEVEEEIDGEAVLKKKYDGLYEKYLRIVADLDNYKKRVLKEKADIMAYGNEELIKEMLSVMDNLERALTHAGDDGDSTSLLEGIQLVHRMFLQSLEKFGVKPIVIELGEKFNPRFHQAIEHIEADDFTPGLVLSEILKGYMLKDKLIRPSLVAVSKAGPKSGGDKETSDE